MKTLELEHVACNLCEKDDYKIVYQKPDTYTWINQFEYPIVRCNHCGLTYVNPRPTQTSMSNFYPNNYHSNRDTVAQKNRYKEQIKFLPNLSNENVLDIGCARGDFLISLLEEYPNIKVSGLDYFSEKVNSDKITFYRELIQNLKLKKNSFDLITAWAVIEHVHDPKLYFKEVGKLLSDNGQFVFLVTNSDSLYGKKAYKEDIPRHTYHFSKKTLEQYAYEANMKIKDIKYTNTIFDGKGHGTFFNIVRKFFNITFETIYKKDVKLYKKLILKIGSLLDKLVFYFDWERKIKKSGIIVVTMYKMENK